MAGKYGTVNIATCVKALVDIGIILKTKTSDGFQASDVSEILRNKEITEKLAVFAELIDDVNDEMKELDTGDMFSAMGSLLPDLARFAKALTEGSAPESGVLSTSRR